MQRQALVSIAALLTLGSDLGLAQAGDLAGVTMRVLDDVRDVDAVVLALDADGGEGAAEGAAAAAAARRASAAETAEGERRELRPERDELHGVDDDERGEGRLEDRDVERAAVPMPAVP
jgi:hypothetical protein